MKMRPDGGMALRWPAQGCVSWIIRRNLRKPSIIGLLHWSGTPDGLESVKKTPQVDGVGMGGGPSKSAVIELAGIDLAGINLGSDICRTRGNPTSVHRTWISH